MPITLSLAMIVRNEEALLERALVSARAVCDELIVVDTGSIDPTVEIAERMGAKVFHFAWVDDFSAARNVALDHCSGDWILTIDADDVLPLETQRRILNIKRDPPGDEFDVIQILYHYAHDARGRCTASCLQERFVRRASGLRYQGRVHEQIVCAPDRKRISNDIIIEHQPDRSLLREKSSRAMNLLAAAVAAGDTSSRTLFYYGLGFFEEGDWHGAASQFERLLDAHPDGIYSYDASLRHSYCDSEMQDEEKAVQWARRALGIDPCRAEAYVRIAYYHCTRSEWELAIPFLEQALHCTRPVIAFVDDRDYTWRPWSYLSYCYSGLGRYVDAIHCSLKELEYQVDTERIKSNIRLYLDQL